MTDPWSEPTPDAVPRCPWCSAEVRDDPANCPSCGAVLREEAAAEIPGVTAIDPAATVAEPRGRGVLGWLTGEYEAEGATQRESVEPPSEAVRAEMARLEMEAIQAEIEAAAAEEAAQRSELGLVSDGELPPAEPGPAS